MLVTFFDPIDIHLLRIYYQLVSITRVVQCTEFAARNEHSDGKLYRKFSLRISSHGRIHWKETQSYISLVVSYLVLFRECADPG